MRVDIISCVGVHSALIGLGLSYGITSDVFVVEPFTRNDSSEKMLKVLKIADKLLGKGGGHDKFARAITVVLDITAPLYWWKQFDTYKVGTVTQSESTMHTLMKKPLTSEMFEGGLDKTLLSTLENLRSNNNFDKLNKYLPQSFLQRRIVHTNIAVIMEITRQRKGHKLPEWELFINNTKECYENFYDTRAWLYEECF